MVESVDEPWIPPRPPAYTSAWGDSDQPVPPRPEPTAAPIPSVDRVALPGGGAGVRPGVRWQAGRPGGRIDRLWSGLSVGRRILLSYLALAVAIALVVSVGGALQPTYGSLAPWLGAHVDDLRAAPSAGPWAIDLAATIAPGTPPQCLRFAETDLGPDLAVVRVDGSWAYGLSTDAACSVVPAGYGSRVALIDTRTGDVRWVHDLSDDLGQGEGVAVTWTSALDSDSRILVRGGTSTQQVVETLGSATGKVLSSTGALPSSQDDRFTASGRVVATGSLSLDDLEYTYQLRDADDLSKVVWSGHGNETATMIALDDRLLLGDRGTLQVPLATGVASEWSGPVSTSAGYAVHDDVVFATNVHGLGVTTTEARGFTAVSKTGAVLWRSDLDLRGSYSITRKCLAATDSGGDTITCLDYRTGKPLWSSSVGEFSFAGSLPGQRSDDVYVVTTTQHAQLVSLDGATGHVRFSTDVPPGSSPVASGRTVAYVLATGLTGARSTLFGVDTSSGHRLWTRSSQVQVAVWAGHVIDIGMDGLARRLGS
ncbi:hypothetical protein AX769_15600 [Frondihabitans sp. PAMC 28766]|uniref:outer membrane protein assembly factor BamB family protein n=1 Tax=Frondihabitans sp. PAMC 28766 TaxID=1795630 RepID=UPI00078BB08F|nr:PQQ-binding-like beta-propeller repeat protein [Frondihabitans sp. PAMC 28766]AMM21293.1 hypothetical protein AX769_15600 [Frondihabitans sp. PAMC 28766]